MTDVINPLLVRAGGVERGLPLTVRRGDTVLIWEGVKGDQPPDDAHELDVLEVTSLAVTAQMDDGIVYRFEADGPPQAIMDGLLVYRGTQASDGRPVLRFWGRWRVRHSRHAFELDGARLSNLTLFYS